MKHLSVDEIIEFVSSSASDNDGIALIESVNEHIRECPKCLKLVRAFQMIYEEFDSMCIRDDFKEYLAKKSNTEEKDIDDLSM